jgi:porphyrinogen peroxidase
MRRCCVPHARRVTPWQGEPLLRKPHPADKTSRSRHCALPARRSPGRCRMHDIIRGMYTPQAGIFALGTSSHCYLEFDLRGAQNSRQFAATIAAIREPRTTTGGVNFVIGFRPELLSSLLPDALPAGIRGFNEDIRGTEGFAMPATQHDALVWLSGSAYDVLFDMAHSVVRDLGGQATLAEETPSWSYRHDRDLTGFIDGSENPTLLEAPVAALVPEGAAGAAGSVLLLQKWKHQVEQWEALSTEQQELIMGRRKLDSIELEDKPKSSHVARTDQDRFGNIFRRNMPYGRVSDHGTMFVGFSAEQPRLAHMLESMAGVLDGTRDALTRFSQPLSGSYYFVPSVESLLRLR